MAGIVVDPGSRTAHRRAMAARTLGRLVLSLALGLAAATILLAVLSAPSPILMVCNVGTVQDQSVYERCLAELPARQAELDESIGAANPMTGPIVALAGGSIIAIAASLVLRRTRSASPSSETD
jgi:hypothetical protein